jgi:hypothetical protein
VIEQADHLAKRTKSESDSADIARITRLFRNALGRGPTGEETGEALAFIRAGDAEPAKREQQWERLAQVLLMSNEFAFVD